MNAGNKDTNENANSSMYKAKNEMVKRVEGRG